MQVCEGFSSNLPASRERVGRDDSSKIVYSYHDGNQFDIYVMNADGSNKQNLTNTPGFSEQAMCISGTITDVSGGVGNMPKEYQLMQNYPNPFNPSTTIEYELSRRGEVTIDIYNSIGQLVRKLVSGETMEAGTHSIIWDGRNDTGNRVSSGAYFYTLRSGEYVSTKKSLLLK